MSQYGEDYQPRRPRGRDDEYPPPPPYPAPGGMPAGLQDHLPPPPMGDNRRPSALKPEGSRSRVPQNLRPDFPDEASYLGSQAPDLERKNRRRDKEFRDKRDGYESEEGEMLRQKKPRSNRDEEPDSRHRRNRDDRDADYNGGSSRRPKDRYEDRPPRGEPPSRSYDDRDRDPPRRRRERQDDDYDDDPPPRRRGGAPPVEYGSEPVSALRRRNTDLGRSRDDKPRRRRDDPDDYSDDDEPPRRHRSAEGRDRDRDRRQRNKYDDEDRYNDPDSRDQRRRRQDMYDRDRDSRRSDQPRRRRYSDDEDEDDYDRRDSRRDRDRDRRKPPREMKVGGYDIGPLIDTGKKHYGTVAPIVAPLLMNAARKYLTK
ncbi:hypothetical protein LTS16_000389 [Friedmanniomyces endolithicus]|nr:hypothetical protein LTR35_010082 [Friedmanniomyces endolithicus]KAK0298300.1 hypothetical protein LTS00_003265 [Friedmanniomyces endolithicus]KAK0313723.1 hypothetical protein LTR01_001980 [Friedmanniomyces endolithicus]KAK0830513.1 hypothetical protein LTR73_003792 [Friedmanniomyces endolithicus]KAK1010787.1 hypothetical protein LTS01_001479 [Friedmanniomyces endolithicus]